MATPVLPRGGAVLGAPQVWIASITIALDVLALEDWPGLIDALMDLPQAQTVGGPYPNGLCRKFSYVDNLR